MTADESVCFVILLPATYTTQDKWIVAVAISVVNPCHVHVQLNNTF